ncbi:glycosyltransferase [Photobacterium sagamiensis]|uniref:glycosyltransferase n=1 Tax=Photobacterium sagamiensis TaxID=2910241 RepID=UPI003D1387E2
MIKKFDITIVIPVYNGEKFLSDTAFSAISQDFDGGIKVLLVDDCSSDDSVSIIKELVARYANVDCILRTNNLGLMASNQDSLNHVSTPYVMYLGQDDLLDRNHVRTMLNEFSEGVVSVWCNSRVIDERGTFRGVALNPTKQIVKNVIFNQLISISNFVSSPGMVCKTITMKEVGGWCDKYRNFGEWSLWIRMATIGKFKFSIKSKAYYRRHSNNLSSFVDEATLPIEVQEFYNECRAEASEKLNNGVFEKLTLSIFKNYLVKVK